MSAGSSSEYEEIPYDSNPFHPTHPCNLATLATLFGMNPPPANACRVLELGCGTGGNLVPMAYALPRCRFVGIDLSPRQIAMGQELVRALGVTNIELQARSILEVDARFGQFDYILCHGVYSWVPAEVRNKIMAISAENLAPQGVAYISYNTYPGWHVRGMIRDMMGYHVRHRTQPHERVRDARAIMDFLVRAAPDPQSLHALLIKEEALMLAGQTDAYVFHEQLEGVNEPVYFHEFVDRAREHGLQFLGEASIGDMAGNLPPQVKQTLQQFAPDLVSREQYLDFLRNRTFRRSLLCHADVPLTRPPDSAVVQRLLVSSLSTPQAEAADVFSTAVEEFRSRAGTTLSTNHPQVKAALHILHDASPRALPFDELWNTVVTRFDQRTSAKPLPFDRDPGPFAGAILQCFLGNLVDLHTCLPDYVLTPGDRPIASLVARLEPIELPYVTNLCHRSVEMNAFDRQVLRLLDGTRDRGSLLRELAELVNNGTLTQDPERQPLTPSAELTEILAGLLDRTLRRLASGAFLIV